MLPSEDFVADEEADEEALVPEAVNADTDVEVVVEGLLTAPLLDALVVADPIETILVAVKIGVAVEVTMTPIVVPFTATVDTTTIEVDVLRTPPPGFIAKASSEGEVIVAGSTHFESRSPTRPGAQQK